MGAFVPLLFYNIYKGLSIINVWAGIARPFCAHAARHPISVRTEMGGEETSDTLSIWFPNLPERQKGKPLLKRLFAPRIYSVGAGIARPFFYI